MTTALEPAAARPRVCIVTNEFLGLSRNGGIGTAITGLAQTLAGAGLPVTVLFIDGVTVASSVFERARARYAAHRIALELLRPRDIRSFAGPVAEAGYAVPAAIFEVLRARMFDVIHFNDTGGFGHYCLIAKRLGLAFTNTLLVVGVHSPHRWLDQLNGSVPDTLLALCFDQAEHASIASADLLWSPSRYLLDWLAANGFRLPRQAIVQQYVMPPLPVAVARHASGTVREVVFFGRLEERKGLRIFCDAVARLDAMLHERGIGVSFMGRTMPIDGMDSRRWIEERSRTWRVKPAIMTDRNQEQALAYLTAGGRLAVMASPADNSPCTVYEAIGAGFPFLAAATGGIPELIHEADRAAVLFDYDAATLEARLAAAFERPAAAARPAVGDAENGRRWVEIHAQWQDHLAAAQRGRDAPPATLSLAVVIFGADDNASLATTLSSLGTLTVARIVAIGHEARRAGSASQPLPVRTVPATEARKALGELAAEIDGPVLFVKAGARVIGSALADHLRGLAGSGLDGVVPAGRRPDGPLVVGLGHGMLVAFHEGMLQTGGTIMTHAAVARGLGRARTAGDAVTALHDAIVLSGAEIGASPVAVFDQVTGEGLCPTVVHGRVAFYAHNGPRTELQALMSVAASVERDGGFGILARRLGMRVVTSRWGSVLAPLLARVWRARRARASQG